MATPREFKKKLWFPYVFAGLAFLAAITQTVNLILLGYDFTFYIFFNCTLPDLAFLAAGVCLILFGRKKPTAAIIPLSLIFGAPLFNYVYLVFDYIGHGLTEYAIFASVTAMIILLILALYILIALGVIRERTIMVVLDGLFVVVVFAAIISTIGTYFPGGVHILVLINNTSAILFNVSGMLLISLPIWYVYSLKKIEPRVIKIALTMEEKIAMIDKLYLMFQKGEITEAEYLEKKKSLLKEI